MQQFCDLILEMNIPKTVEDKKPPFDPEKAHSQVMAKLEGIRSTLSVAIILMLLSNCRDCTDPNVDEIANEVVRQIEHAENCRTR
jgi:hypothetical protein